MRQVRCSAMLGGTCAFATGAMLNAEILLGTALTTPDNLESQLKQLSRG